MKNIFIFTILIAFSAQNALCMEEFEKNTTKQCNIQQHKKEKNKWKSTSSTKRYNNMYLDSGSFCFYYADPASPDVDVHNLSQPTHHSGEIESELKNFLELLN